MATALPHPEFLMIAIGFSLVYPSRCPTGSKHISFSRIIGMLISIWILISILSLYALTR